MGEISTYAQSHCVLAAQNNCPRINLRSVQIFSGSRGMSERAIEPAEIAKVGLAIVVVEPTVLSLPEL